MDGPFQKRGGRSRSMPRMETEAATRQGQAVGMAWAAFGDSDRVRSFLNTPHDALGGRPLDVAIASAAGLALVGTAIDQAGMASPPRDATLDEPSETPDASHI